MNSNNTVACPLDCFDACEAVYKDGVLKGSKEHQVTNGKLCVNFANLLKEPYLKNAIYNGEKISLDKALNILVEKLKTTKPENTLFYKGAGNLGVMQSTTKSFFAKYGAVSTKGSLCDEIGAVGLAKGREGKVVNPPVENLLDVDVVISWGRNLSVSSPHMYNLIKDKTFITIDPIKTDIAKKSELHLQVNPKTDHELALLLTRFAHMQNLEDKEFLEKYSKNSEDFFDLAKSKPVVSYEAITGVSLTDITKFFEIIKDKKVAILLGIGIQKYFEGAQIIHAIDSFAAFMGIHNKDYGGVWYLDDSSYGYTKPFDTKIKKEIPLPMVDFSDFELIFMQGANPVVSSPNTQKVIDGLKKSFVVFFGTVENDSSVYADLIIPSPSFLEKGDVRLSYGHNLKAISYAVEEKDTSTITEYELTQYLNEAFDFEKILDEEKILDYYRTHNPNKSHKIENFDFIEELDVENLDEKREANQYFYIMTKRKKNLNSQFQSDDKIYLNPASNIKEGSLIKVKSKYGEAIFEVGLNEDIKENCVLTYAGNKKANYLTPFKRDEIAESAILQEVLVTLDLS